MMGRARAMQSIGLALALAWTWPVSAADCGDSAGAGGARVPCACGDSVVTDTTLAASDPIVVDGCKEDVRAGLGLVQPSVTLDCAGLTIDGPGFDSECAHDETCGAGILISRRSLVAPYLKDGRLIAPFAEELPSGDRLSMLIPPAGKPHPRRAALIAWLEASG